MNNASCHLIGSLYKGRVVAHAPGRGSRDGEMNHGAGTHEPVIG
jgi:hypothetical protein